MWQGSVPCLCLVCCVRVSQPPKHCTKSDLLVTDLLESWLQYITSSIPWLSEPRIICMYHRLENFLFEGSQRLIRAQWAKRWISLTLLCWECSTLPACPMKFQKGVSGNFYFFILPCLLLSQPSHSQPHCWGWDIVYSFNKWPYRLILDLFECSHSIHSHTQMSAS